MNSKLPLLIFAFFSVIIGCSNYSPANEIDITEINVEAIDSMRIVSAGVDLSLTGSLNRNTGLIATKRGFVLTPFATESDTLSFLLPHDMLMCCDSRYKLVGSGRGPKELNLVTANTKTMTGDTVVFFSNNNAKFLVYNENLDLISEFNSAPELIHIHQNFVIKDYIITSVQNPKINDGYIFKANSIKEKSTQSFIAARVPDGFEPGIRNDVSALSVLPDGFAFTYSGDKEILFLKNEKITRSISFGSNDPFKKRKSNPIKDGSSTSIYISKMEFDTDRLFVLYKNQILVFSYPDLKANKRLTFFNNTTNTRAIVTNFSVYRDLLYVVYLNQQISQIKMNPEWFE